jgi:hypothetical protein
MTDTCRDCGKSISPIERGQCRTCYELAETTRRERARPLGFVKISRRVYSFLEGTGAGNDARSVLLNEAGLDGRDPDTGFMVTVVRAYMASTRADGSCMVPVTARDLDFLYSAIGAMEAGAEDGVREGDRDQLPDLNASRALLRKIKELRDASN